ncbi:nucleotide exchange factor GrpE [Dethiobacter alkaliphilus]|uniref:nucleotide exchange factor GrpE n=1 Tax=Dethiobacter alkaliphilus TaxID=427926 RepID=UPI002226F53F|nr:nucleotide exchange factor GrpE [Dethiobacter alkaliphilus]MCW3489318.1 nucleotide exchange factor GrpE [Dethiobacter alkaliphilus]
MSEEERKEWEEEAEQPRENGDADDTPQEEAKPQTEDLKKLQEENAQLFSRLQRLQADFDNYRKRVKAEKQELTRQAVCDLVRELLPVIDNLERAKEAKGSEEALAAGVDLVYKQFMSILEKQGLSGIEACGNEFDPNCHHAVMQVECDLPENEVAEELQKGYRLHDKVLRPSMVKVAK